MKNKTGVFVVTENETIEEAIKDHYNGYAHQEHALEDAMSYVGDGASIRIVNVSGGILGEYQREGSEWKRKE